MDEPKTSFWGSLPGIFTALATFITAIGGLVIGLANVGIIDLKKSEPKPETKIVAPKDAAEVNVASKTDTSAAKIPPKKEPAESAAAAGLSRDQLVAKYKDSGRLNLEKGHYFEAMSDFEEALKIKPNDAWSLRYLSEAYKKSGQPDKALTVIDQAVQADPNDLQSYRARAMMLFNNKAYDKAIDDFKKILEQQPNNVWALSTLADCYQFTRQQKSALEFVDKSIKVNPNYAFSYRVRGRIHLQNQDYAAAVADFQKSLELEPNNTIGKNSLQKAQQKLNEVTAGKSKPGS
jgi:tetratricopeptide (TPR) repeat protein